MKAVIKLDLKLSSPEESQKKLTELCDQLKADGVIDRYSFELNSEKGTITEKCILAEGKVIA